MCSMPDVVSVQGMATRSMIRSAIAVIGAVMCGAVLTQGSLVSAEGEATETYIVLVDQSVDPVATVEEVLDEPIDVVSEYTDALPAVAVELSAEDVTQLELDPSILAVLPNYPVSVAATQSRPIWSLDRIDQRLRSPNRQYSYSDAAGTGVDVYVFDTGLRSTVRDLRGRIQPGFGAVNDGNGTNDCHGHGTHVAGTVAGSTWGVAKRATIIPVRVLGCEGTGTLNDILNGAEWMLERVDARPDVPAIANFSLGIYLGGPYDDLDIIVEILNQYGITVVAAAGNDGGDACNMWPARAPGAITVAATDANDVRATFSNYGPCVDIFAPGVAITSASHQSDSRSVSLSGTSMAAPHVAGAAALVMSTSTDRSPSQVSAHLLADATVDAVVSPGTGSPNRLLFIPSLTFAAPTARAGQVNSTYRLDLRANGGLGPYTFTATNLPPGLSLSGSRISGRPTERGEWSSEIAVTDRDLSTATQTVTIVVNPPAPSRFSRLSPRSGQTGAASAATVLTWGASTHADYYELCVSTSRSCNQWTRVDGTTTTLTELTPATRYYWQVRAVNPTRAVTSSGSSWSFTTAP
jgi:subtilisin family serine protease